MSHLRDYQLDAIADVSRKLLDNPILVLPTGGGKTYVAVELIKQLGMRTLWIAHRRELIAQAAQRLTLSGLSVGVIQAGYPEQRSRQVQVASVQTLVRRTMPAAQLIVVDECHHARASTYRKVLDHYPGCPVVGLTATPFRLDGRGLGDVGFRALVVAAWPDELIERGVLVEPTVYAPDVPSMQGVRRHHGEYSEAGLSMVMDRPQLVGNIVATWQRLAAGRRTVVFSIDVAHSRHIVEQFTAAGVKAEHLDGATSTAQRDATLHRLKIGYTTVVSQCAVLSEGWDMPALEVAVLARPTASLCVHLQQLGRVCRAAPDKTGALVLDHAGNHLRLGPMTQRVDYSLDDVPSQAKDRGESSPERMKRCPQCLLLSPLSAETCVCGHTFQSTRRKIKHVEGELQEYSSPNKQREAVPFDLQAQAWAALQEQREHWGYLPGWAMHRFKSRFGFWPVVVGGQIVDTTTAARDKKVTRLAALIQRASEKQYKPGWAKVMYRNEFGQWPSSELIREAELLAQQVAS